MRVVCAWCERERKPALLREVEPLDDLTDTHGICAAHHAQILRQLAGLPGVGLSADADALLPDLVRLRAWLGAGQGSMPRFLLALGRTTDHERSRLRAALAEQANLRREVAALRAAVVTLQEENRRARTRRREVAAAAEHLLDDVLRTTVQPLHALLVRLRAAGGTDPPGRSVDSRGGAL